MRQRTPGFPTTWQRLQGEGQQGEGKLRKGADYQRTAAVGKLQSGYLLADQAADDGC